MALDVDSEENGERDELGRTISLPNAANGDGVDDDDFYYLASKDLLTWDEIKVVKSFKGLKCLLPMKWALVELREMCAPENRMVNTARNYEALQDIAVEFNKVALLMVTQMQQPVPFVYFHVLKLMVILVGALISYELVYVAGQEDDSTLSACMISTTLYVILIVMLIGLNAVGGAMADPFGNDDTDFDTRTICDNAYKNAVAYLRAEYVTGFDEVKHSPLDDAPAQGGANVYVPM